MSTGQHSYKLVAGRANPVLAQAIADFLRQPLCRWTIKTFTDGEIFVAGEENMRGTDVFVIQPTGPPVNDNLMELLILIDALKRASAARITAVVPYYGYARQEKKDAPREPITARLVADMLEVAGTDRVVTIDLHAGAIQGFFNIPIDHLTVLYMVAEHLRRSGWRTASWSRRHRRAKVPRLWPTTLICRWRCCISTAAAAGGRGDAYRGRTQGPAADHLRGYRLHRGTSPRGSTPSWLPARRPISGSP